MLPMSGCMVYRYFDRRGRLLYVGVSTVPRERDAQHRGCRGEFSTYIAFLEYEHYPTVERAREVELQAIQAEYPVFNSAGRDRQLSIDLYKAYVYDPANQVICDIERWVRYERAQQARTLRGANQ